MSLFKVCTWWSAQCPDFQSNYDAQLLHCCRFGVEENEKDYVIVASHSGYVSIFQPNATMTDETEDEEPTSGFRPTDQLLEIKLTDPIIQLSSMCFCSFVAGWYYEPDARLIITVVSESGTILIYNTSQLIWAAQLSYVPMAICRTNVNGLPGAICTLSETGKMAISYLGSDPQMFQVPPLNMQKLNFEKTQTELIELEKEIKAGIDFTDMSSINASAERDLNVDFSIDSTLEQCKYSTKMPSTIVSPDDMKMVRATVKLHAQTNLEQIQVQFYCSEPLTANKAIHSFQQMNANQSEIIETCFYMENSCDIASKSVVAVTSFINKHTIPRVIEKTIDLPLKMFFKTCIPQKDSAIKLTITVNQTTVPTIDQLFANDFPIEPTHNAIGFKSIYSGKIVTIVAAKNSNRFRLQSDHLPTIAPILESIVDRIEKYTTPKIRITNSSPLPVTALITLVDIHYKSYEKVQIVREKLKNCTIRMRLLERRYFTKLDDKKTGSIDSIVTFLKTTHQELMTHIQTLENAKQNLSKIQCDLSCGLACVNGLIKLIDVPPKGCDTLRSALMSTVTDYPQQSWEEMTAAGLNILTYVGPLKKNKNGVADDDPTLDVAPFDFERFKRHLTGLLERVSRQSGDQKSNSIDETLTEEDDINELSVDNPKTTNEESDWIFDVKQTMDILPRLQNNID